MKRSRVSLSVFATALTLAFSFGMAQDAPAEMTDEEKIADAMSAGPASITQDATIAE